MTLRPGPAIATIAYWRLRLELAHWARLNEKPRLWWRDDDARSWTPALERLLIIADGRPLTLAVVPDDDLRVLAHRLRTAKAVTVCQHGVDHLNRRGPGEAPCEHRADATVETVHTAIETARERMRCAGLEPLGYVPPWNETNETLLAALKLSAFAVLSADSEPPMGAEWSYIGVEIDILRWKKGPPRFRGSGRILRTLRRHLNRRRNGQRPGAPIGLLTHHLSHDPEAWRFLAWFLGFADIHFQWTGLPDLVATAPLCPRTAIG